MLKNLIIYFFISYSAFSYINIYPIKFEKNINQEVKEEFFLYNRTNEKRRYRIYIEDGEELNLKKWIEIYPKSITLRSLEEKSFSVYINPPKDIPKGKYTANLVVKEVNTFNKVENKKVKILTQLKIKLVGNMEI